MLHFLSSHTLSSSSVYHTCHAFSSYPFLPFSFLSSTFASWRYTSWCTMLSSYVIFNGFILFVKLMKPPCRIIHGVRVRAEDNAIKCSSDTSQNRSHRKLRNGCKVAQQSELLGACVCKTGGLLRVCVAWLCHPTELLVSFGLRVQRTVCRRLVWVVAWFRKNDCKKDVSM